MAVWECDSSAAISPVLSGSISPLGATGMWGGRRFGAFQRRCLCYVCFRTLTGRTGVKLRGWGLMFWHSHWCAGTWGGRAHPVTGRGKTRSRRRRSRSYGCRGSWGNTALLGRIGPDTPADTDRGEGGLDEIAYTQTKGNDAKGRRSTTNTRT